MSEKHITQEAREDLPAILNRLNLKDLAHDFAFLDWDVRTGKTSWDQNWSKLFNLPHGVFRGNAGDWEKAIHCLDLAEVLEILNDHLNGETSHFDLKYRLDGSCDNLRSVHTCGVVIARNKKGRPTRVIMISQEISHQNTQKSCPAKSLNLRAYSPHPEEEFELSP